MTQSTTTSTSSSSYLSDPVHYPPSGATNPYEHSHGPELRRSSNNDLMFGEGSGVIDEFDMDPFPLSKYACVLHPSRDGRAYFFCGNTYVVIRIRHGVDTLVHGPANIYDKWPSLSRAGFAEVDAVLPNPIARGEMYIFSGTRYALIDNMFGTSNDVIINGPESISTEWPSLDQSGFIVVDAVLPSPTNLHEMYVFSGNKCVLIHHQHDATIHNDYIVKGPNDIWSDWPALEEARFETVGAILPHPTHLDEAYFFSRDQYALVQITDNYVIQGPNLIRYDWPSLHQASFW